MEYQEEMRMYHALMEEAKRAYKADDMCRISDKRKLRDICLERAEREYGGNIPEQCFRAINQDIQKITDAGFDKLYMLACEFFSREENRTYNVSFRGYLGSSPTAYFCGLTPFDPLQCGDDIPVFPEFFYGFYTRKDRLPFYLDWGMFPDEAFKTSDFYAELEQKRGKIYTSPNLYMLDQLESVIGEREKSLMFDGEGFGSRWLETLWGYGPETFRFKVLDLFPDFRQNAAESPQGLVLLHRLLEQGVPLNRRNLARIQGLLCGSGTIDLALALLDEGVPFASADAGEWFIAFPEDLYGYLKQRMSDADALRFSFGISREGRSVALEDMEAAGSCGVPADYLRRIEKLTHLYPAVQCYAHAGEFLRLVWYYENYPEEYRYLFHRPAVL